MKFNCLWRYIDKSLFRPVGFRAYLVIIILALALSACDLNLNRSASTPTVVSLSTQEVATSTKTPRPPTVTAIPAATKTPTPTQTPLLPTRPPIVLPTSAFQLPTQTAETKPAAAPAPQASILAFELNVRAGPGLNYPVNTTLKQGETVRITGLNFTQEWYQVARNDQIIGWISASPQYVTTSPPVVDVPLVGPPPGPPPAPAGQGKLILQTESGGAFYLVNADGTNLRYIASGIDPAFSPDGAKIAFTRWGSGEIGSVWVYDLASGTEAHILGEMFEPKAPTWSPDGTKLVINYQHGGRRYIEAHCLDFIDVLTGRRRIPDNAYDINVGSESSRICFKLPADTHWQLRSIDVATGNFDDLASDTYSYAPTWDPVNSWRIIFAGSTGLQQLDLNRNEYWPFTTDVRDYAPVISPDGSKVAVSYRQHDHWEIYTISTADGARARLTKSEPFIGEPFNSASPAWSPNSQKIAFVTDRSGQWEFWVMNADGSDPRPLLPPEVAAQLTIEYHGVHERLISWSK